MERRKAIIQRRREVLLALLKLILTAGAITGAIFGVRYVFRMSDAEVLKISSRPGSEVYLSVDDEIRMSVINEAGQLAMQITGDSVTLSKNQQLAIFKGAKATYYENGAVSLTIEAGVIQYDTKSEDFNISNNITIVTRDGMSVAAEEVEWRQFKQALNPNMANVPSFRFPKGVLVTSREGNTLSASYMQADRELQYMEFVGNFRGDVHSLKDTQFITERDLTDTGSLKLDDFTDMVIQAETVIYDKRNQVLLATSRFYDKSFVVKDFNGDVVDIAEYQADRRQVSFSKKEVTIATNHLEAHLTRQWVECYGNIGMVIQPAPPKYGEDKALQIAKQSVTRIAAGDLEYYWGRDYVISHDRTYVEQADRRAEADKITYWGDERMVLLDGNLVMAQGSGDWLFENDLLDLKDQDQQRIIGAYTEMSAQRAVIYLRNNDFIASGAVMVRQDNREIAADTIVYQDEIKLLTAQDNVKFRDSDGQTFVCAVMTYDSKAKFMEVSGGSSASIRLPAKFSNDIRKAIAESREKPVPADVTDPPVPSEPTRNPNQGQVIAAGIRPPERTSQPLDIPSLSGSFSSDNALPLPGEDDGMTAAPAGPDKPKELLLQLGGDGKLVVQGEQDVPAESGSQGPVQPADEEGE